MPAPTATAPHTAYSAPNEAELLAELAGYDLPALAAAGLRRDPGGYNLLVHMVPPEVARDHAATADVERRLAEPTGPLGLYLHLVPCTGRCTFCHYAIAVNPAESELEGYLAALQSEITMRWAQFDARSPIASVLVGGGTPTYLSASQLDRLFSHLRRTVHLPAGIEFTVEGSPETITADKLQVLRDHGVNRLSLGIQSFDDKLLRVLGRRHDAAGALHALELARAAGFAHLNLDLIYALPGQTLAGWLQDVQRAVDLGIDSLTTYHLRKRPNTAISRHASPAEQTNLLMHLGALRLLQGAGYRQSLVDYFCKADLPTAQVQARDKWRDMQPVDGCGVEACSRRPDVVAFDCGTPESYVAAVGEGRWPLAHGRFLSREEQMAQRAMFALKVLDADGGLHIHEFETEFSTTLVDAFGELPAQMQALGVLHEVAGCLRLTDLGTLFADEVCQLFYTPELRRKMRARVKVVSTGAAVPLPRGAAQQAKIHADVVVVGAGIVGLAAAVALAEDLGSGVLLLEAEAEAGLGATAASIGGFRTQFAEPALAELSHRSLQIYERYAQAVGAAALGFKRSGYLFLAVDGADAALYERQAAEAARYGECVERLAPTAAAQLVPGLATHDLHSAYYGPRDGQLDPHGVVRYLRARFAELGGRWQGQGRAQRIRVVGGRVVGVDTADGWIAAGHVVVAAGSATAALVATAGVALPLHVARRRMVWAQKGGTLPGGLAPGGPLVLSRQPAFYFRTESAGVLLSARELTENGAAEEAEWLAVAAERATFRLPALRGAQFRPAWSGEQTHAPDQLPLVGPCPGLDGLWLAAALGGTGVMHAPAVGTLLTAWLGGVPADSLAQALDPRRLQLSADAGKSSGHR